jgi:hypothetical protein
MDFLAQVRVGSHDPPWSWQDEFDQLVANLVDPVWWKPGLFEELRRDGQREPVQVGPDGRCWDGHHRVVAAMYLGWAAVLVEYLPV